MQYIRKSDFTQAEEAVAVYSEGIAREPGEVDQRAFEKSYGPHEQTDDVFAMSVKL